MIPEPADKTLILLAHPTDGRPERVFYRDNYAGYDSGYGVDDDGNRTGRHWYEVVEFPEAPITWADLVDLAGGGPIHVLTVAAAQADDLDQVRVERDWLLAEADYDLRVRFFAIRAAEARHQTAAATA